MCYACCFGVGAAGTSARHFVVRCSARFEDSVVFRCYTSGELIAYLCRKMNLLDFSFDSNFLHGNLWKSPAESSEDLGKTYTRTQGRRLNLVSVLGPSGAAQQLPSDFARSLFLKAAIAQLGERQAEDLKVPCSILDLGICVAQGNDGLSRFSCTFSEFGWSRTRQRCCPTSWTSSCPSYCNCFRLMASSSASSFRPRPTWCWSSSPTPTCLSALLCKTQAHLALQYPGVQGTYWSSSTHPEVCEYVQSARRSPAPWGRWEP